MIKSLSILKLQHLISWHLQRGKYPSEECNQLATYQSQQFESKSQTVNKSM